MKDYYYGTELPTLSITDNKKITQMSYFFCGFKTNIDLLLVSILPRMLSFIRYLVGKKYR